VVESWRTETGDLGETYPIGGTLASLHVHPVDRRLAVGDGDGTIHVFDPAHPSRAAVVRAHEDLVTALAFDPTGRWLASGGRDGTLRLWDAARMIPAHELAAGLEPVVSVAFSPDGRRLLAGTREGAYLVRVGPEGPLREPFGHHGYWMSAAVDPTGRVLATGDRDDPGIWTWDLESGRPLGELSTGDQGTHDLAFHPEGALLAVARTDDSVWLVDLQTRLVEHILSGLGHPVVAIEFDPAGEILVVGTQDGTTHLWRWRRNEIVGRLVGSGGGVLGLAFHPDGGELAVTDLGGALRLWDLSSTTAGKLVFQGPPRSLRGVAYSPDGSELAFGGGDQTLRLWNRGRGTIEPFFALDAPYPASFFEIGYHPDGHRLGASPGDALSRHVWDRETGDVLATAYNYLGPGLVFDFTHDGRGFVGSDAASVRPYDTETGRPLWRAPILLRSPASVLTHEGWIALDESTAEPLPDTRWRRALEERALWGRIADEGRVLCILNTERAVEIWDLAADEILARTELKGEGTIAGVAALPDACLSLTHHSGILRLHTRAGETRLLVDGATNAIDVGPDDIAASHAGELTVFDLQGNPIRSEPGFSPLLTTMRRTPHGIAHGDFNGALVLVPVDGSEPWQFGGPETSFADAVILIRAGPADTLLTFHANGALRLWYVPTGEYLDEVKLHGRAGHLEWLGSRLVAVTELGDYQTLDLGVLDANYCELLEEVWAEIPVGWQEGRAVPKVPPDDHDCLHRAPPLGVLQEVRPGSTGNDNGVSLQPGERPAALPREEERR